jgi:glyoxylase-like metal-dependent hydrolase (beta-lactamase superfamily II)
VAGGVHWQGEGAEVHKVVVGPMDNNVFVLRCTGTGEAVLVDAANEAERILGMAKELNVDRVLTTHGHWDHIQAVPQAREAGYRVAVSAGDAGMLPGYDDVLEDDTVLEVGRLRLRTILTPGHTPGSMCFRLEGQPLLFTGDTLFPGGPGNTEQDPERFATILKSIDERLFPNGDDVQVLPGHGDDTTIGTEKPHFDEWVERGW